MPIDDLLGTMHKDELALHDATLQDIDEKIQRVRDDGRNLTRKLEEQLHHLNNQRLNLEDKSNMGDADRTIRFGIEREIRDREIMLETVSVQTNRDLSFLEGERRRVTQYVMKEQQLHEQINAAFYDPKP